MQGSIASELERYGAEPAQLVDLEGAASPRTLRYVDLVRSPGEGVRPVVYESQGQPRAYVFDGTGSAPPDVTQWIRRVAFRGDADWVGVVRPGRLDVYPASLRTLSPTPVEGLPTGRFLLPALVHELPAARPPGVRARLLALLQASVADARASGVRSGHDALSLVGRALFWRFLIDRGLLEGLQRSAVCPGATSWQNCMESSENALHTFRWLDETFNGGLLPFATPPDSFPEAAYSRVLGNIAHLAPGGQLPLRLPSSWGEVNFAHVPVGLLSEVYEAYAHGEDKAKAKAESIHYTPRRIAEFVVDEALAAVEDVDAPRVLDPAAGAGVFLVAAFRALVARAWSRSGVRPTRASIRRILNQQIVGFDINDSALRLAELALYLTAIELDPEARPRPLTLLRFDALRGATLIARSGGPDDGSLAAVEPPYRAAFDVVVGNPPWTAQAKQLAAAGRWADKTRGLVRERLGERRATDFEFPGTNPDLPFVYRAMEWAKVGGTIALVTDAQWLFGQRPKWVTARRDLLEIVHVTGILNGAALRDTSVWPNVRHPFCLLFAQNELPPPHAALMFTSPALDAFPDSEQERIRIDWNDARPVDVAEAISRWWTFKARFRGTAFDETVLADLHRRGVPLGAYLAGLGTGLRNGYKVGGTGSPQATAAHLSDLPDLGSCDDLQFVVTGQLPPFARATLHKPRPRGNYLGPLLLAHESMLADRLAPRAILVPGGAAFDERFDGASFAQVPDGADIACYLQLVIQSSVFKHALLLMDQQFGIEREVVLKATIQAVPVVPWSALGPGEKSRGQDIARRASGGLTDSLHDEIDAFVADVYRLSRAERDTIRDTLNTALPTADAKRRATQRTSPAERSEFVRVCEQQLVDVLAASGRGAYVRERIDLGDSPWRLLQVDTVPKEASALPDREIEARVLLAAADDASASLLTVKMDGGCTLVGILDRYRYWTVTRARMLALTLAAEMLPRTLVAAADG